MHACHYQSMTDSDATSLGGAWMVHGFVPGRSAQVMTENKMAARGRPASMPRDVTALRHQLHVKSSDRPVETCFGYSVQLFNESYYVMCCVWGEMFDERLENEDMCLSDVSVCQPDYERFSLFR